MESLVLAKAVMLGVQVGWIDFSPEERSRTLAVLRALPANVLAAAFRQSISIHDTVKSRLLTGVSAHVCLAGQSFGAGKITQFIQCGCSRYARVCW